MVADGEFPRPVRLSPNRVGWAVETVRGHMRSTIEGVTRLAVSYPDNLAPEDIEQTMREPHRLGLELATETPPLRTSPPDSR